MIEVILVADYKELKKLLELSMKTAKETYPELVDRMAKEELLFEAIDTHYKALDEGVNIRPTLGNEMQILYMRDRQTFMFALFPELLTLAYYIGKVIGAAYIAPRISGESLDELLKSNVKIAPSHKYGYQKIVWAKENEAVYRTYECADCYGLPNIGLKLCVYEAGTAAGAFEVKLGKRVEVEEEKCCANGDEYCEFHIYVFDEPALLGQNTNNRFLPKD